MPFVQLPGVVGARQALQENDLFMQAQQSDLQSAALNQENARLQLEAKKAELANQEAFKASVLAQLSNTEDSQSQLAELSNQPTPHQQMQTKIEDTTNQIDEHTKLVRATQRAIDQYSKTDPIYAQRMQKDLNDQIEAGFKLTTEHNKILADEAKKVSQDLYPVMNADGVPGKIDPIQYAQWYGTQKANGVPLAQMGLTGDAGQDGPRLQEIYSHGTAIADQLKQQKAMYDMKEKEWRQGLDRDRLEETARHNRAVEATSRERVDKSGRGGAVKDPVVVERKEQDAAYGKYRSAYDRLVAQRRKATDPVQQRDIDRQITSLNENFEEQKKAIRGSYGLVNKGQSQASSSSVEDDLISKYSQ